MLLQDFHFPSSKSEINRAHVIYYFAPDVVLSFKLQVFIVFGVTDVMRASSGLALSCRSSP